MLLVLVHEAGYAAFFVLSVISPIHNFWLYLERPAAGLLPALPGEYAPQGDGHRGEAREDYGDCGEPGRRVLSGAREEVKGEVER